MAGRIPTRDIEAIKQRVNIADIVGEYVQLKGASVGSLKGLCPFHDEKSPSFNVRPDQGFYHCFGCSEGGDVYKFLQKIENITRHQRVTTGWILGRDPGRAEIKTSHLATLLPKERKRITLATPHIEHT